MSGSMQTTPTKGERRLQHIFLCFGGGVEAKPCSVMDGLEPGTDPAPLGSPPSLPSTSRSGATISSAHLGETDGVTRDDVRAFVVAQWPVTALPGASRATTLRYPLP
ncbi:hypothetical protein ACOMHN_043616 [Nucella lapillus]